jgi:hypothetical protein
MLRELADDNVADVMAIELLLVAPETVVPKRRLLPVAGTAPLADKKHEEPVKVS